MSDVYSSQRLDLRRPPAVVSVIQIIGSVILFLIVLAKGISLVLAVQSIDFMDAFDSGDPEEVLYVILLGSMMIVCLVLFIKSLSTGIKAFSEFITPWRPSHIPVDYKSESMIVAAFKSRILSSYQQFVVPTQTAPGAPVNYAATAATPNLRSMKTFFGPNTMFLSPVERRVVDRNAGAIKGGLWGIFWLVAVLVGAFLLRSNLNRLNLAGYFIAIGLLVVLAILDYTVTMGLIPRYQPNTVAHEATDYFRGFGHPSQLINRLNEAAIPLRWKDFPNRFHPTWFENASTSVGDVGNFSGSVFLEQQPQPLEEHLSKSAYTMMIVGWILLIIGNFSFLFLAGSFLSPVGSRYVEPALQFLGLLVQLTGIIIFSSISASNGTRLVNLARFMFDSARFRSLGIYIEFAGNLSKAEIKLGKGMADSIESSNVAVRSDFTARFWSAEMISEAERLDAPRDLLALNQNPESAQWINFFKNAILQLREERVKPVGVELRSAEAEELIQANISIAGLRAQAQNGVPLNLIQASEAIKPPELPSVNSEPIIPQKSEKTCNTCGNENPANAAFCNSCGTRL